MGGVRGFPLEAQLMVIADVLTEPNVIVPGIAGRVLVEAVTVAD